MVVREFHSARFFNIGPELMPRFVQSACIHVADDEEMGDARPAKRGAFRHQPGYWASAVDRRGRCAGFGFGSRENVGSKDFSARSRSAHIGEIDAAFAGEASRFGGNLNGLVYGLLWGAAPRPGVACVT